jgi:hypothetical protein
MRKERRTEALYHQLDDFLKWTGLLKAVKGTPSLLAAIIASVATMECVAVSVPIEYRTLAVVQPVLLVLGVLVGVISVEAGNFWDRKVFNPRYGLGGTWLTNHPWAVFPPGSDLKYYRDRAIKKLKPDGNIDPETGERVYRESKKIVERYPARWAWVDEPNTLSKFARNFIMPFLAAAVLFVAEFARRLLASDWGFAMTLTAVAATVCIILAILLFIPYFSCRIEHMIRLYSEAVEILDRSRRTRS